MLVSISHSTIPNAYTSLFTENIPSRNTSTGQHDRRTAPQWTAPSGAACVSRKDDGASQCDGLIGMGDDDAGTVSLRSGPASATDG
jgi:hypothetical protein